MNPTPANPISIIVQVGGRGVAEAENVPREKSPGPMLGLFAKRHEFDGDRVRKMFELRSIVGINAYSDDPAKYNVSCQANPAGRSEACADRNVLGLIAGF